MQRWYEIGFDGDMTAMVLLVAPHAQVSTRPACTILWQRVRRADEFDVLLDSLLDMGITPSEVHEAAGGIHHRQPDSADPTDADRSAQPSTYCEVRIIGRLGDAILQYLGWSHRVVETTVVRLRASDDELRQLLDRMAQVTRLDYVLAL